MTDTPPAPGLRITRDLARRIVDQVAPSLQHNVNIMDADGVIIGAVDRARIGTTHDAARSAARTGLTVQVTHDGEYGGTRPGVNIPLLQGGEVVAVVGVTGNPDEVLALAQVLVLAIQMLLEQEQLRDNARWRESATRDLLSGLTLGTLTEPRLVAGLAGIGLPLHGPWNLTAVLLDEEDRSTPGASVSVLRHLQAESDMAVAELQGVLWVLTGSSTQLGLTLLKNRLLGHGVRLLTGRVGADIHELGCDAQRLGVLLPKSGLIAAATDTPLAGLGAEVAVAHLSDDLTQDACVRTLPPLTAVLRQTAEAFLNADLSIAQAAAVLGVHRNTLVQRLDRIELLTGLNIRRFSPALTMKMALLAAQALYVHGAHDRKPGARETMAYVPLGMDA